MIDSPRVEVRTVYNMKSGANTLTAEVHYDSNHSADCTTVARCLERA
jgi:hypothetical protein